MINILEQKISWNTTAYDGELLNEINNILTLNLRTVCKNIIKYFPKVVSIYLLQSFARGEGSVLIKNGKIKFLSDYDLLVVSEASFYNIQHAKKQFETNFSDCDLHNIEVMSGHPIVELKVMNHRKIRNLPPSLFKHELKTAVCVYGRDLLNPAPKVDTQKIPVTEGFSLLFNRMLGALLPFCTDFLNAKLTEVQSRHLTFESVKLISGCRDALLILDKFVGLTEKEKQDHFTLKWHATSFFLQQKFPEFLHLCQESYLYRIKPHKKLEQNSLKLWFKSLQITSEVLKLYLEKLYGLDGDSWFYLIDGFMTKNCYNYSYTLHAFFSSLFKIRKKDTEYIIEPNKNLAALILLIFSVDEHGIDDLMLDKAKKIVGLNVNSLPCQEPEKIWMMLKKVVCSNYVTPFAPSGTFYMKFQALIAGML